LLKTATKHTTLGLTTAVFITLTMSTMALGNFLSVESRVSARVAMAWGGAILFCGLTTAVFLGFQNSQRYYNVCCMVCQDKLMKVAVDTAENGRVECCGKMRL